MTTNPVNIAAVVEDVARSQPQTIAIQFPLGGGRYQAVTYGDLLADSDRLARGLEKIGVRRGMRTVLMVTPSPEFFALVFGLMRAGIPPVIVDPGMGIRNLKICLDEAQPEVFIGIPKAHAARLALGWARETLKIWVTVGRRYAWGGQTLDEVRRLGADGPAYQLASTRADETAAIIFTSGSTGVPKGVVYTHGNFAAQVEILRSTYRFQAGEVDLPTFPVFALFDPALGMTTIIPEMDFTKPAQADPEKLVAAIQRFGVTTLFGSPAVLNRIGRYYEGRQMKLTSVRRVISAGAPVPADVLRRFAALLPYDAEIFTPYGATEALPITSISHKEILGETAAQTIKGLGVCVGRPVEGVEICTIPVSDAPINRWDDSLRLPIGAVGEITVRGQAVTREYFNREASTQQAKIPIDDGFFHRMGDVGRFDEQGRLWFYGRKTHRVETDNGTLFSTPIEEIFNTHPAVYRTALVGVRRDGKTEPVLCVELEAKARRADRATITRELLALGESFEHTRPIRRILYHAKFPVDIRHNAKIFREKLALWAAKQG